MFIPKLDTKKGLGNLQINLAFDMVFSILAIIVGVTGLLAAGASTAYNPVLYSLGAALCGALVGLIIIFIINFIISLLSIFAMRDGAPEFGPDHERNVYKAFAFKWMGTIMSITAVVSIMAMLVYTTGTYFGTGGVPPQVYVPVIISILWTAGVSFKALMYVYFVKAIAPPEKRSLLPIALWSVVVVGILAIALIGAGTFSLVTRFMDAQTTGDYLTLTQGFGGLLAGVFLAPGFAIVGYVLFTIIYAATAKAVREGRIQPQYTAPPPVAPAYLPGGGVWQQPPRPPPPTG
jgi:hypothetical protein